MARPPSQAARSSPGPVPGHHIVLARDLERAVRIRAEFLGVTHRRAARGVLGRARPYPLVLVDGVAGDEQVPADPVAECVHRLADVAGNIAADIHDRIPAAREKCPIITGVPVADQPGQFREQVGPGLPPAEQGHLGSGSQGVLHDGATHERRAAKNKNPHSLEPYCQPLWPCPLRAR